MQFDVSSETLVIEPAPYPLFPGMYYVQNDTYRLLMNYFETMDVTRRIALLSQEYAIGNIPFTLPDPQRSTIDDSTFNLVASAHMSEVRDGDEWKPHITPLSDSLVEVHMHGVVTDLLDVLKMGREYIRFITEIRGNALKRHPPWFE